MELRKKKTHKWRETIAAVSVASLIGAIGLLAFWCTLVGIDIWELGAAHAAGILVGLFGGIFGLLLLSELLH